MLKARKIERVVDAINDELHPLYYASFTSTGIQLDCCTGHEDHPLIMLHIGDDKKLTYTVTHNIVKYRTKHFTPSSNRDVTEMYFSLNDKVCNEVTGVVHRHFENRSLKNRLMRFFSKLKVLIPR